MKFTKAVIKLTLRKQINHFETNRYAPNNLKKIKKTSNISKRFIANPVR